MVLDLGDQWSGANGLGGQWSIYPTEREGGGGACEVLPLRKWGAKKVLAMLKMGHNTF